MTEDRLIVSLCRAFGPGVLPSQVLAEDASVIRQARMLAELRAAETGGGEY